MKPTAIIDAHHHLWRLDGKIKYPWLQDEYDEKKFILGKYRSLCQDFDATDFKSVIGDLPVVATIHVEAECSHDDALNETKWLHEVAKDYQGGQAKIPAAVVVWVDLLADDAQQRILKHLNYPLVRGVRFKPRTSDSFEKPSIMGEYTFSDSRWSRALALLSQYNLIWDLRVPFWSLSEAARLLEDNHSVSVVLEHTGLPWNRSKAGLECWRRGMQQLARLPNVAVKISELGLKNTGWNEMENRQIIKETIEIFGVSRCMFASNFPVASLRVSYASLIQTMTSVLEGMNLGKSDCHAIWYENANRIYRLNLPHIMI